MEDKNITNRKKDHIDLAARSRTEKGSNDQRFFYEPLMSPHPSVEPPKIDFLGKQVNAPIWISSMTGGTGPARHINQNLARVCAEFGLSMGLGSCRPLLDSDEFFEDFNLRPVIGPDLPFYANLGVAQVEELIGKGEWNRITLLVERLQADGLIIHVNPLQEWLQPEGDRFRRAPIETIGEALDLAAFPIIVKEVGQGMGPESLRSLLQMKIEAIEFGAFGGTNFARLELLRSKPEMEQYFGPIALMGHTAEEMVDMVNDLSEQNLVQCRQLIISGGITSFVDGHYLVNKSKLRAVYGQASAFLKYANESYESLREFTKFQIEGLKLASAYFKLKQ